MLFQNGFYRTSDKAWVSLERIQFVGACNPPTDPGRNPLSTRFLRHVPVIYVDYPGQVSLKQIYGTFNRAMLRGFPAVRGLSEPLTDAMVEFYVRSQVGVTTIPFRCVVELPLNPANLIQERFTQDDQPHYVYSPRELTRWVRGISEAISPLDNLSIEGLVRLWGHEAIRLFMDRLVHVDERKWTDELVNEVAKSYFGTCNFEEALKRPILYSCWLTRVGGLPVCVCPSLARLIFTPSSHSELHARLTRGAGELRSCATQGLLRGGVGRETGTLRRDARARASD